MISHVHLEKVANYFISLSLWDVGDDRRQRIAKDATNHDCHYLQPDIIECPSLDIREKFVRRLADRHLEARVPSVRDLAQRFRSIKMPHLLVGSPSLTMNLETEHAELRWLKNTLARGVTDDISILVAHNRYRVSFASEEDFVWGRMALG